MCWYRIQTVYPDKSRADNSFVSMDSDHSLLSYTLQILTSKAEILNHTCMSKPNENRHTLHTMVIIPSQDYSLLTEYELLAAETHYRSNTEIFSSQDEILITSWFHRTPPPLLLKVYAWPIKREWIVAPMMISNTIKWTPWTFLALLTLKLSIFPLLFVTGNILWKH